MKKIEVDDWKCVSKAAQENLGKLFHNLFVMVLRENSKENDEKENIFLGKSIMEKFILMYAEWRGENMAEN